MLVKNDKRVYEGQWLNNMKHGNGYEIFPNGTFYKGQFRNHKPSGYGVMVWCSGEKYEGEWENGFKNG